MEAPIASSHTTEETFPFTDLPVEIQQHICSCFCIHCNNASPSQSLFYNGVTELKTLKALSETSRDLYVMAHPIMFHCADVSRYSQLLRTLMSRPDLAAAVKSLPRLKYINGDVNRANIAKNDDLGYIKQLDKELGLTDRDDPEFKEAFEYLLESPMYHFHGLSRARALSNYRSLVTTIFMAIIPNLQFAVIDLEDGRDDPYNIENWFIPYPYLPTLISNKPQGWQSLNTIVFTHAVAPNLHNLGLDSLYFLFKRIPNVRRVIFDFDRFYQPPIYDDFPPTARNQPQLYWPAIHSIEEIYYHPCVHKERAISYIGILNFVARCVQLKKFVFRISYYYATQTYMFSPKRLLSCLSASAASKSSLKHLEIYCSDMMAHNETDFAEETLLTSELAFFNLTNLVLDEGVFCRHWLDLTLTEDSCLVNILPQTVSYLTIRMHKKYTSAGDIILLGKEASSRNWWLHLVYVDVQILNDSIDQYEGSKENITIKVESNEQTLPMPKFQPPMTEKGFAFKICPFIEGAFRSTTVKATVKYIEELSYPRSLYHIF